MLASAFNEKAFQTFQVFPPHSEADWDVWVEWRGSCGVRPHSAEGSSPARRHLLQPRILKRPERAGREGLQGGPHRGGQAGDRELAQQDCQEGLGRHQQVRAQSLSLGSSLL